MRNYIVYLSDNNRIGQTEFYGGDYSPEDVIADAKSFYSRPYKIEVMEIEGDLSDDEIGRFLLGLQRIEGWLFPSWNN